MTVYTVHCSPLCQHLNPSALLEIISSLLVSLLRSASACKIAEEFLGWPDRSSSHPPFAANTSYAIHTISERGSAISHHQVQRRRKSAVPVSHVRSHSSSDPRVRHLPRSPQQKNPAHSTALCGIHGRPPISIPIPTLTPLALPLPKQLTRPHPKVLNILQRPLPPPSPSQHQSLKLPLKKPHITGPPVPEVLVVFSLWLNNPRRIHDLQSCQENLAASHPPVSQLIVDLRDGYESVACEA
jgi:hypothetical protein